MPKLTKRWVDALRPDRTPGENFVWDTDVKGFGIRVKPSGTKSFVLKYRVGAKTRRYTISKVGSPYTVKEARKVASDLLRDIKAGRDPMNTKIEARAALTVRELADLYLVEGPAAKPNKKPQSWTTDQSNIRRHIIPLLGAKLAKSLTEHDVARFQRDVANGKTAMSEKTKAHGKAIIRGGRGTAARSLAVLGAMLEFGVRQGVLSANSAKGVKLLKGEKRERFLSDREVAALADALAVLEDQRGINATMAAAIRLLMLSGCRKNEVLGLRWDWVDFDRACLRLPDSKTGAKVVPLAAAALEILCGLAAERDAKKKEEKSPYVLPASRSNGPVVGLQKAWEKLRNQATELARRRADEAGEPVDRAPNLSGIRIHDLRHSFASFAVADGATLFMVGKVLGHKQARTTEIYAHLADDPLRALADRTASKIAEAMNAGTKRERPKAEIVRLRQQP